MRPTDPEQPEFTSSTGPQSFRYAATEGALAAWNVDGTYDVAEGRIRVTSLTIRPRGASIPPNGITGTVLRKIRPARFTDRLKAPEQGYAQWLEDGLSNTDPGVAERYPDSVHAIERLIEQTRDMAAAPRSGPTGVRGARRINDDFLSSIAQMHRQQINDDGTYGSTTRLAAELNKPYNTVKDWIAKAKQRGLYPPDGPSSDHETE